MKAIITFGLLMMLIILAGCGRKGDPIRPDQAPQPGQAPVVLSPNPPAHSN